MRMEVLLEWSNGWLSVLPGIGPGTGLSRPERLARGKSLLPQCRDHQPTSVN